MPLQDKENQMSVLNKTVGLIALMRLLGAILNYLVKHGKDIAEYSDEFFFECLKGTGLNEDYFTDLDATSKTGVKIFYELNGKIDYDVLLNQK